MNAKSLNSISASRIWIHYRNNRKCDKKVTGSCIPSVGISVAWWFHTDVHFSVDSLFPIELAVVKYGYGQIRPESSAVCFHLIEIVESFDEVKS